jgi:hypothetical protein
MPENEEHARGGGRVLLASDMVRRYAVVEGMIAKCASHLLLTYPTPSNALEAFILSRAEESTHSAMLVILFSLPRSIQLIQADILVHASCASRPHANQND